MKKLKIEVNLKENVMDPKGQAVCHAIERMGITNVKKVRIGKVFHIDFEGEIPDEDKIHEICDKLLSNPVIENYKQVDS